LTNFQHRLVDLFGQPVAGLRGFEQRPELKLNERLKSGGFDIRAFIRMQLTYGSAAMICGVSAKHLETPST